VPPWLRGVWHVAEDGCSLPACDAPAAFTGLDDLRSWLGRGGSEPDDPDAV
jgi:hypothetical protein